MTHQPDVADGRDIVARWCALAELRLEYLTELFETGRWRRFHSERAFLENIQEAKAAVETWRDLSSREASCDNRAIDMSWLGRSRAALPREDNWPDQVRVSRSVEISAEQALENSIVPLSDAAAAQDALSTQPVGDDATGLTPDMATIAERYPLLHNAL
ncbi:TIGR03809 family protein [Bradyrhizobium sp.]|uniref:TIGR03809 family protein n=1 Tax=Bradyrhizobium sp. TaxID=376 RepID=UPI003C754E4E